MSILTISPSDVVELFRGGKQIDLIDVRTPMEYRSCTPFLPVMLPWIVSIPRH